MRGIRDVIDQLFDPETDGRTRVHVQMSYTPPAGWLGHGVAKVFRVDPKHGMDADLVRMKTLSRPGTRHATLPTGRGNIPLRNALWYGYGSNGLHAALGLRRWRVCLPPM